MNGIKTILNFKYFANKLEQETTATELILT